MYTGIPTPDQTSPASLSSPAGESSHPASKSQRILACVQCQSRKVKCNRKFPCINCQRAGARCIPGAQVQRQRRRRFPEKELIERLRQYEDLLSQNNIAFEPLHGPAPESVPEKSVLSHRGPPGETTAVRAEPEYKTHFWDALNQKRQALDMYRDDDGDSASSWEEVCETEVKGAWDELPSRTDHLLFGSRKSNVSLSTYHPEQVQIFRLWQKYLENVSPLLKVTHTPTLQARIIDVVGDLSKIPPVLEALMFSIYCVSVLSLDENECMLSYGASRKALLAHYQYGCQQALLNCDFLRSKDRDCLTALFLYLVSIRPDSDPRSLAPITGTAMRIAQRLGINCEQTFAKYTAFEAEMCRRLWWSLLLLDARTCEMSDHKSTMLTPIWDCKTPVNVNDFDLQPDAKLAPKEQEIPTEAIFSVVRSELADSKRHSAFQLDFTYPILTKIARNAGNQEVELSALEQRMETQYLSRLSLENPLHFMTLWTARSSLAQYRMLEYYSRFAKSTTLPSDDQRDTAVTFAMDLLDCDTQLMASPLTKRFHWHMTHYFPFPAYIHILQDLRRRPFRPHAKKAWKAMGDNNTARFASSNRDGFGPIALFAKIVSQAWEGHRDAYQSEGRPLELPDIVKNLERAMRVMAERKKLEFGDERHDCTGEALGFDNPSFAASMGVNDSNLFIDLQSQGTSEFGWGQYPEVFGQGEINFNMDALNWTGMDDMI